MICAPFSKFASTILCLQRGYGPPRFGASKWFLAFSPFRQRRVLLPGAQLRE